MKTFSSLYFWSANTDKLLKKVRPGNSLISYACDVTWLTHQAQGKVQLIHFTMKKLPTRRLLMKGFSVLDAHKFVYVRLIAHT